MATGRRGRVGQKHVRGESMNDLTTSDFAGLEYSHKQRCAHRQWADLEEREPPLTGLYRFIRNFLLLLSAGVSFGIATYFWSLL
jgi:hypothetical protein